MFAHEYCYTIDQFLDLTPRQFYNLSRVMERRRIKNRYPWMHFFASLHHAKIPTLEEILGPEQDAPVFDKKTDEFLEKIALERFKNGR